MPTKFTHKFSNSNSNIINNHSKILISKFNINLDDTNKQFLPKLHTNTIKSISEYPSISDAVSSALKTLYKQIEAYNAKSFFSLRVKTFWPVKNKEVVLTAFYKLNNKK